MKPNKVQRAALAALALDGGWVERGTAQITAGTATALWQRGWIEDRKAAAGRWECKITDAGRKALES